MLKINTKAKRKREDILTSAKKHDILYLGGNEYVYVFEIEKL